MSGKQKKEKKRKHAVPIKEEDPDQSTASNSSINESVNSYQEHCFLSNQIYFDATEERLVDLLKRREFTEVDRNNNTTYIDKLEEIRDYQMRLAQMHFDMEENHMERSLSGLLTDKSHRTDVEMDKLMKNLKILSTAVQNLHQNESN